MIALTKSYFNGQVVTAESQISIPEKLFQKGAHINHQNNDGWTVLFAACHVGNVNLARFLLEANADPNICSNEGTWEGISPLMSTCTKGYVDIVKILLEKGADINKQDQDGWTALHWASDEGHQAVVDILLEANPDLSICSKNCKRSPLKTTLDR